MLKRVSRRQVVLVGVSLAWMALALAVSAAEPPATDEEPEHSSGTDEFLERTVALPRYVVSAMRIEKNPWRYASVPGFEILSRASDHDTNWMIAALQRGRWLEDQVLPADWLPPSPTPYTVIIDDTDLETIRPVNAAPLKFAAPEDALTWGSFSRTVKVAVGHSGIGDQDTYAFNTNVHDVQTSGPALGTISLERLSRCSPALPLWTMAGLLGKTSGIFREGFALANDDGTRKFAGSGMPGISLVALADIDNRSQRVVGPGVLWISLDETQRLVKRIKDARGTASESLVHVPPLDTLFVEVLPSADQLPLWESEAALFVRWGLMGPGRSDPVTSAAFLRFVQRTRSEPATERLFVECFGFDYATMEKKLARYLVEALPRETSVTLPTPARFAGVDLAPATADQIGRILGDWLRMRGRSMRRSDPAMSATYLDAAGRMLRRAYQSDNGLPPDVDPDPRNGRVARARPGTAKDPITVQKPFVVTAARIRDPHLLAIFGLYEHDAGRPASAREFLEKATKTGAERPGAYLALAQLRFAEANAKPAGAGGKFNEAQVATILAPLEVAMRSSPTATAYGLLVDTWARGETRPADADIAIIADGVAKFPRHASLVFKSARLCAQLGDATRASGLIDQGLVFVTDERIRAEFERLRGQLAVAGSGQ